MARRVQTLVKTEYVQELKTRFYEKIVVSDHNQILTKLSYQRPAIDFYKVKSWAKFEANTFNGIQLIAGLFLETKSKTCADCNFKIYAISTDDAWNETFIGTLVGIPISGNRFKAAIDNTLLAPFELTGEISFRIEVELTRVGKTFKDFFYVNHIGIYGNVIQLRQDVDFLNITKKDL